MKNLFKILLLTFLAATLFTACEFNKEIAMYSFYEHGTKDGISYEGSYKIRFNQKKEFDTDWDITAQKIIDSVEVDGKSVDVKLKVYTKYVYEGTYTGDPTKDGTITLQFTSRPEENPLADPDYMKTNFEKCLADYEANKDEKLVAAETEGNGTKVVYYQKYLGNDYHMIDVTDTPFDCEITSGTITFMGKELYLK